MGKYAEWKHLVLPLNIIKKFITSVVPGNGLPAMGGIGNEGVDLTEWIQERIDEHDITIPTTGGSASNLTLGVNNGSTQVVTNSNGTGITIPAATSGLAGLLTAAEFTKLASLVNYVHPNHSGDVVSTGDGATVIQPDSVTNAKQANMAANTVKVNNTNASANPVDMAVAANKLVGRGQSGNLTNITLGANLVMTGDTLSASSSGGSSITPYAVAITGGNTNATLEVTATATGVLASYAAGELTITVPEGVILLSAFYRGVPADIQVASDGSVTNWVRVKFVMSYANTGLTNVRIPNVQKTLFGAGSPGLLNPYTITQANNPGQTVVGISSNSVTIRMGSMSGATQGYQLTFTGF